MNTTIVERYRWCVCITIEKLRNGWVSGNCKMLKEILKKEFRTTQDNMLDIAT